MRRKLMQSIFCKVHILNVRVVLQELGSLLVFVSRFLPYTSRIRNVQLTIECQFSRRPYHLRKSYSKKEPSWKSILNWSTYLRFFSLGSVTRRTRVPLFTKNSWLEKSFSLRIPSYRRGAYMNLTQLGGRWRIWEKWIPHAHIFEVPDNSLAPDWKFGLNLNSLEDLLLIFNLILV